jgi:hypothetical protein
MQKTPDSLFTSRAEELAALALRHRVPAIYQYPEFTAAGGLMSYGGSLWDSYHRAGTGISESEQASRGQRSRKCGTNRERRARTRAVSGDTVRKRPLCAHSAVSDG